MNKFILPVSIILGCVILGGFFYASQINKQVSIEKQQELERNAKRDELRIKTEIEQKQVDKENNDAVFTNNLKCQSLLKDLKQRWNNVIGIYYDENLNTCIVKYKEEDGSPLGRTREAPIEDMQDN